MEKKERLRKCKGSIREIRGENEYKSKKIKKLDMAEEKVFRRGELPEKFIAKMLYR